MNTIKSLFVWLGRAFGDGENPSSSRIVAVPTLLLIYIVPLLVWAGLSIYDRQLLEFPGSVIGFISAVSTPILVFLHWNKRVEEVINR